MSNSNSKMIVFASILGAILATGILALNPSTIGNAQAQMYSDEYGYESNDYYQDDNRYSYDKKDSKSSHTDIQKIKCVNSNINVNGVDITKIPEDTTATAAANEGGTEGANTENGNGFAHRINFDRNLVNVCVNVNGNEQAKVSPQPEESIATLSVSKTVSCTPQGTSSAVQIACNTILSGTLNPVLQITPYEFLIDVSGNNPNPRQFPGSTSPVDVTLDAGNYQVTETPQSSVQLKVGIIEASIDASSLGRITITGPTAIFTGHCSQTDDFEATGTIETGETQTCNIENNFVVSPEST